MTKNLDSEGLKSIAENYDLFYIDLWGVMHNGIELHEGAIYTLKKLLEINKNFVLLTNAPRPIQPVKEFLEKMGMEEKYRNKVFTSGEAALNYLKKFYPQKNFIILAHLEILIYLMTLETINPKILMKAIIFYALVYSMIMIRI
jgi:ribonucleotide monophosphatase NagD (HAD superfamily)